MNEYTFFFVEANFFSILISLILIFREIKNGNKRLQNIEFLKSIIVYILFYLTDILWALSGFNNENKIRLGTVIIFVKFSTFIYGSYQWYIYSEVYQGNSEIYTRKNKLKWGLPIIFTISVFFVYMFFIVFSKNKSAFYLYKKIIYIFITLIAIFYEIVTCVKSLKRAYKNKNDIYRDNYIFMGISPIFFCLFIILQAIFFNIPIFCFLNTVWMICLYLKSMDDLISIDSLTKLNNRNQLKKYFRQLPHDSRYKSYVLVIDIDHFKLINDKYGHLEGDNALVLVADTFKKVCGSYPHKIFISRYGGDEFVFIVQASSDDDVLSLKEKINNMLKVNSVNAGLPYTLCVSIGFAEIKNYRCDNLSHFISEADKKMYLEKESKYKKQK